MWPIILILQMRKTKVQWGKWLLKVAELRSSEKPRGKCSKTVPWHEKRKYIVFLLLVNWAGCQCADVRRFWKPRQVTHQEQYLRHPSGPATVFTKSTGLHWPASWECNRLVPRAGGRHLRLVFQCSLSLYFLPSQPHALLAAFQATTFKWLLTSQAVILLSTTSLLEVGLMCSRQIFSMKCSHQSLGSEWQA